MKITMQNAQNNSVGIAGSGLSWLGVVTSELATVEQWLHIVSMLGATAVSVVTIYYLVKRNNPKQ